MLGASDKALAQPVGSLQGCFVAGRYYTSGRAGGRIGEATKKFVDLNWPPFSSSFHEYLFFPEENLCDLVGGWVGQHPTKAKVTPPPPPAPPSPSVTKPDGQIPDSTTLGSVICMSIGLHGSL